MARRRTERLDDIDEILEGMQVGRMALIKLSSGYDWNSPIYKEATDLVVRLVTLAGEVSGNSQALLGDAPKIGGGTIF